jgi:hypothetical protein
MPKTKKPPRKTFSIYVDQEMLDWLAEEATREARPVSQLARIMLKEARAAREKIAAAK